ncbi:FecR/PupR family sigma factor regulator, partial [Pseudomonas helleri]
MTDTPPPNLVWETALDWLLLIQQNPDDPELNRRLNDWRASAPEHEAAWRKAQKVWQLSGAALSLPSPPAAAAA